MNSYRKLDKDKLKLAKIKYYDSKHNGVGGVELSTPVDAYAFLYKINDTYINLFDPIEELPIFKRTKYTNTTKDGEDYGNMLVQVSGTNTSGPCFVIENITMPQLLGNNISENITYDILKNYIYDSSRFFPDRIELYRIDNSLSLNRKNYIRRKKLSKDIESLHTLKEYFNSHDYGKTYIK